MLGAVGWTSAAADVEDWTSAADVVEGWTSAAADVEGWTYAAAAEIEGWTLAVDKGWTSDAIGSTVVWISTVYVVEIRLSGLIGVITIFDFF